MSPPSGSTTVLAMPHISFKPAKSAPATNSPPSQPPASPSTAPSRSPASTSASASPATSRLAPPNSASAVAVAPPSAVAASAAATHSSVPPDPAEAFSGAWLTPPHPHSLPLPPPRPHTPGLQNLGNTCFLNAALQCLLHSPPLLALLLHPTPHRNTTPQHQHQQQNNHHARFCPFCAMRALATTMQAQRAPRVIAPSMFARNARLVCPGFRQGRQEDSHEFVRGLLDGMLRAEVFGCGSAASAARWDREMAADIHRVFGGVLQSSVRCSQCHHASVISEPFLDLSLEIARVSSLEKALARFTDSETLDGDNKYRCDACRKLVRAVKRFSVRRAPNVLTLHLKRFDRSRKDPRYISFSDALDLGSSMYGKPREERAHYKLTAVLVHQGSSRQYGHYFAYVKGSNGSWCLKDDSTSRTVPESTVLKQKAYLLFYARVVSDAERPLPACAPEDASRQTARADASVSPRKLASSSTPTRGLNSPAFSNSNTPAKPPLRSQLPKQAASSSPSAAQVHASPKACTASAEGAKSPRPTAAVTLRSPPRHSQPPLPLQSQAQPQSPKARAGGASPKSTAAAGVSVMLAKGPAALFGDCLRVAELPAVPRKGAAADPVVELSEESESEDEVILRRRRDAAREAGATAGCDGGRASSPRQGFLAPAGAGGVGGGAVAASAADCGAGAPQAPMPLVRLAALEAVRAAEPLAVESVAEAESEVRATSPQAAPIRGVASSSGTAGEVGAAVTTEKGLASRPETAVGGASERGAADETEGDAAELGSSAEESGSHSNGGSLAAARPVMMVARSNVMRKKMARAFGVLEAVTRTERKRTVCEGGGSGGTRPDAKKRTVTGEGAGDAAGRRDARGLGPGRAARVGRSGKPLKAGRIVTVTAMETGGEGGPAEDGRTEDGKGGSSAADRAGASGATRTGSSSLFCAEGVDTWEAAEKGTGEGSAMASSPGKAKVLVKRRRANDEMDVEYDTGKQKKVRKKVDCVAGDHNPFEGVAQSRRKQSEERPV